MSLFPLLAAMSGDPSFEYVGKASHAETLSTVPVPTGAREGDYMLFLYFPRTISGGSGTAWNVVDVLGATAKLAHRRLEPGDLTTPIALSGVSPVVSIVYRGIIGISAERTSVHFTGSSTGMAGFAKSGNAVGLLGLLHGDGDVGFLQMDVGSPWTGGVKEGPDAWFEGLYYLNGFGAFDPLTGFGVTASVTSANKYASVLELLV